MFGGVFIEADFVCGGLIVEEVGVLLCFDFAINGEGGGDFDESKVVIAHFEFVAALDVGFDDILAVDERTVAGVEVANPPLAGFVGS